MIFRKCICLAVLNIRQERNILTSAQHLKTFTPEQLKTSKTKSVSSQKWLARQLSDPYVEKAKMMNLRCRSAFKLIEIDDRFKILEPGFTVIDCGAAPGSWTQVVVSRINSNGKNSDLPKGVAMAIDRQQIYPIEGATIFGNMDFTSDRTHKILEEFLKGAKANVVLSDMAPSATGVRQLDTENIMKLCYSVLRFALVVSQTGGTLLVKLWQCGETKKLETDIARFYNNVKVVKPHASRSDSAEIFLLGRDFKGLKNKT